MTPGTNMELPLAKIPVRSERQAMDWSLALVSQGIETTIEHPGDDNGWNLVVAAGDYENALKTLRQYRVENRHWPPWQQALPWPEIHFDWGSVVWAILLSLFYWFSANNDAFLKAGWLDIEAASHGEWWRLFTAIQLHANLAHLAGNLSIGILLLGLAMGRYGTGVGLLAAYLAGVGGNLASFVLYAKPFHGLGASGMVMGALGLLAAQALTWSKVSHKPARYIIAGIAAGVLFFALFGMTPGTDMVAHFGGFVSGFLLGSILTWLGNGLPKNPGANLTAGMIVGITVGLTWTLALLRAKLIHLSF
ncbi:MAG: Rhomboid family protein [Pedosphaera sp.]|nr:Rhomboid family protein [Pedosphaera sp.]